MLTLFHAPQSRSTRLIWLLEEAGADYAIEYVTIPRMDGSGGPDPRNPHPDKKVPALVHDGALVTESVAIMQYVTDLHPQAGIGPLPGDPLRGPYLTWLAYYAGVVEPVVTLGFLGLLDNPGLHRAFRGKEDYNQRILGALAAGPYMLGERFSAVDVLLASMGHWIRDALADDPLVDDYLKRCSERPALAAAMARDAEPATT